LNLTLIITSVIYKNFQEVILKKVLRSKLQSMHRLTRLLNNHRKIRAIGFDDAPFDKVRGVRVNIVGVVCSNTRFEGMLFDAATKDGNDATKAIMRMLKGSKFLPQLNIILIDGIAVGGFNIVNLEELYAAFNLPCVAVMRKIPDMDAIKKALRTFEDCEDRMKKIARAGRINQEGGFIFQVVGAEALTTARALGRLTDNGKVPEALRLAHLIGSAVMTGESGRRA
jgi:endonuclease V-like protein UPF0215 family